MRTIKIESVISICLLAIIFSCQNDNDAFTEIENIQRSKLDDNAIISYREIPDWIVEYVTPEEYEMWEIMSTRFSINYDFLLGKLTTERKKEIYKIVTECCERIKRGEESDDLSGVFIIAPQNHSYSSLGWKTELLTRSEGNPGYYNITISVYESLKQPSISVKASISYTINGKTVTINNKSLSLAAQAGLNAKLVTGDINVGYNSYTNRISGQASGSISFEPRPGYFDTEDFRTNVSFIP